MESPAQFDDDYRGVCRMFNEQRRINCNVVGDSHGVRLYNNLQRVFRRDLEFRLTERKYARGGATARTSSVRDIQRDDGTHVFILWIQGNDLDENHENVQDRAEYVRRQAARGIFRLFRELTRLGKIVYVVLLPARFRFRGASTDSYDQVCRRFNNLLRTFLGRRVIGLDQDCYAPNAYVDGVHLTNHFYNVTAERVCEFIRKDLRESLTLPSSFLKRFFRTMRNHAHFQV